ncbi:MAG TPA: SRPBCC domain-containing protein [Actinomycetota bacterium]
MAASSRSPATVRHLSRTPVWCSSRSASRRPVEPFVGGRFVEVWDEATGEGFEIGRVRVWEPGRRVVYSWRQADWPPGQEMEIEVSFDPAAGGTLVTIEVRGWERLTGGAEIGRGYGEGAKELLSWYAEAAAAG